MVVTFSSFESPILGLSESLMKCNDGIQSGEEGSMLSQSGIEYAQHKHGSSAMTFLIAFPGEELSFIPRPLFSIQLLVCHVVGGVCIC